MVDSIAASVEAEAQIADRVLDFVDADNALCHVAQSTRTAWCRPGGRGTLLARDTDPLGRCDRAMERVGLGVVAGQEVELGCGRPGR